MLNDRQVIERVVAGDTQAYEVLVKRYEGAVFRLVGNLLRNSVECEDVAQEVFLAAFTNLHRYEPDRAAFSTWLLTIARNRCLNMLNRISRPSACQDFPRAVSFRSPALRSEQQEQMIALDRALDNMPAEQRTAFVLSELVELSLEEISEIEQTPLGTIKSRISRAKTRLRTALRYLVEES